MSSLSLSGLPVPVFLSYPSSGLLCHGQMQSCAYSLISSLVAEGSSTRPPPVSPSPDHHHHSPFSLLLPPIPTPPHKMTEEGIQRRR